MAALVASAAPLPAHAESSDIIVLRSVEPRIAYRGIPKEDMPVTASVEPFPTERFGRQTDAIVSNLTDRDLAAAVVRGTHATSPAGAVATMGNPMAAATTQIEGLGGAGMATAGGAPSGIAGQITQATGAMTGSLMRALAPLTAGSRP